MNSACTGTTRIPTIACAGLIAVRTALEQNHIGWTMWDYQGGFGVVTKTNGTTTEDDGVLRALGLRLH